MFELVRSRVEVDSGLGTTKLELSEKDVPGLPVEELARARDGLAKRQDDFVACVVNLRAGRCFGTEEEGGLAVNDDSRQGG